MRGGGQPEEGGAAGVSAWVGRAVAAEEPEREGTRGSSARSGALPSVPRARAFPKQDPRVGGIGSEKAQ